MPQQRTRVAVIGSTGRGNYGHGLDTVWRDVPRTEVVAVADDNAAGLAEAARRLRVERTFADYRRMLDEMRPQVVAIGPRWLDQHKDMVLAAAERGIHVYMEKPFCRTLVEADAMVAACEQHRIKLAIAHQSRYSPKLPVIRDILESGKLGKVLEFRARGKEDRRGGGEDTWVLGSHMMDLIRHLGGPPAWCFGSVMQAGHRVGPADVAEGPEGIGPLAGDAVEAMFGLPEGQTAYFSSHREAGGTPSRFGIMIYGSKGVLEIQSGYLPPCKFLDDPSWSPGRSNKPWQDVSSNGIGERETLTDGGLHAGNVAAVNDLLDAIAEDRQPESSVYEALGATEMIVSIFESHRQNAPVRFPLQNRTNPLTQLRA